MNNKHQENGALTGPLIFTIPASSFIVVLSLIVSTKFFTRRRASLW